MGIFEKLFGAWFVICVAFAVFVMITLVYFVLKFVLGVI